MGNTSYYEEKIFYTDATRGKLANDKQAIVDRLLRENYAVGIVCGTYEEGCPVEFISQFALDILGYTYHEFIEATEGKAVNFIYQEDYVQFADSQSDGDGKEYAYRMLTKDNGIVWCQEVRVNTQTEQGDKQWVISLRTVDELFQSRNMMMRALQDATLANHTRDVFLSYMSHDLRTPLSTIIGMTEIAMEHLDDPEKLRECLNQIRESSRYLSDLVNDILESSREETDAAEKEHEYTDYDLVEVLTSCGNMLMNKMNRRQQEVVVDTTDVTHTRVAGDRLKMQQLITNILSNSIKYTPDGGKIWMVLREKPCVKQGVYAYEIIIRDTGIGIAKEYQEKIFEPFFRIKDQRMKKASGNGLGMTIARSIAQSMHGDIKVDSQVGVGSTFTITVFLKHPKAEQLPSVAQEDRASQASRRANDQQTGEQRRVLLVEDNEINREIVAEMLSSLGITTDTAADGKEGVNKFASSQEGYYDMIFMDIQMPVMNGYEATKLIRAMNRSDVALPIIATSANAFTEDMIASQRAGMNEHLAKPLDYAMVKEVLERWR